MYHIYSSSIFVLSAHFPLVFLVISCASQTFEYQSETDFLPYVHSLADFLPYVRSPGGGGVGGREIRISIDRDDRMGAKVKTQKHP